MEKNKQFEHRKIEKKWSKFWEQGKWFEADVESGKPTYTVLIPPPNVTSKLHMGHGLNNTLQDVLVRYKRMQGYNCLWLPGTDHAGIATQMMVEKDLKSKGLSRKEVGRPAFFRACEQWRKDNGNTITSQLKRLGVSCDWSREAYTLDKGLSSAVREIFVRLYNDGLIYRGKRLVNWDTDLQTAISDDEVENKEVQGNMWFYRYPVLGDENEFVTIATDGNGTDFGDLSSGVQSPSSVSNICSSEVVPSVVVTKA